MVDRLKSSANVECVFGKPFESHGKLYVPVASVRYGFGGGDGSDGEQSKNGHMGGGVKTRPAGVLEVTTEGARFIHFEPSWRQLIAAGMGIWIGLRLLGGLRRHSIR